MQGRVLIVDDDQNMCELVSSFLSRRGFQTAVRTSGDDAFSAMKEEDFDVIVTDLNLGGMGGLELCERIVANRPDLPVIVITAFGSLETAVGAIRVGAYDFITKPFQMAELAVTIERAIQHRALREEVKRLRQALTRTQSFDEIIGTSAAMKSVYDMVDRVADTDATVLITGESGTGKELVARALHNRGRRTSGAFVAINCAAMPETLLEAELFGHAKGAFTDAKSARTGLFVQANGGTLFLDEIGELPVGMQPKLLRALQERKVRPVGGNTELTFDARIIAATNRDLDEDVADRRFREDLYYRINVVRISVPPLRARGNDVLLLAQQFLERYAEQMGKRVIGISSQTAQKLLSYRWPGNVRELQNCIERAVALTQFEQIAVEDLPERIRDYRSTQVVFASDDPSELLPMEEVERRYVLRVLHAVGGNKSLAAQVLGFDRKTLYRKLERCGEKPLKSSQGS
jgi:two-component system response regulator HydG